MDKQPFLFEKIPYGLAYHRIIIDESGKPVDCIFLDVNMAFETITGIKKSAIIGEKLTSVLPGIEDSGFGWIEAFGSAALTGKDVRFREYCKPLSSWYDVTAFSNTTGYFYSMFIDASKNVRSENSKENYLKKIDEINKNLKKRIREVEAATRAKNSLISGVSHEIRTPLNAIFGFSQILESQHYGTLNTKQSEYVDYILKSSKHLLTIIDDLLDLSRIENDRKSITPSPENIKSIIEDSIFVINEKAKESNQSININIPEELHGLEVLADKRRLNQIMFNLLSNAARFTQNGGAISITLEKNRDMAVVHVSDTGVGIAPEDQGKIFDSFYQVNSGLSGKDPGSGLGLPLVKKLVESHGGRIWVESDGPGKGSRFSFSLPVHYSG